MKLLKLCVLLCALCFVGCSGAPEGAAGDANDPALSGDDDAQMNEEMDEGAGGEEAAE